jgi:hypothetical protein
LTDFIRDGRFLEANLIFAISDAPVATALISMTQHTIPLPAASRRSTSVQATTNRSHIALSKQLPVSEKTKGVLHTRVPDFGHSNLNFKQILEPYRRKVLATCRDTGPSDIQIRMTPSFIMFSVFKIGLASDTT